MIDIQQTSSLLFDPINIKVTNLERKEEIEFRANLKDERGRLWTSHALFRADGNGEVDLATSSPISGTYASADAMGLFWSMQLDSAEKDREIFLWKGMDPLKVQLSVKLSNGKMFQKRIDRMVIKNGVKKLSVKEKGIDGNLYLPAGEGPFPGVIVLAGTAGGYPSDAYVAQFANHGYAALGLAFCNTPSTPSYLANIPLEYFCKAIQWMQNSKEVDSSHLFMVGTSIGGTASLAAASKYKDIKGVISIAGRGFIPEALETDENSSPQPMFNFAGKPLPFLPCERPPFTKENYQSNYYLQTALGPLFKMKQEDVDKIAIRVEKIQGPVLLIGTLDDRMAASAILCEHAYERLRTNSFPYPYDFLVYKGAGHTMGAAGFPNTPSTVADARFVKEFQAYYFLGGNPYDIAKAQVASWAKVFEFLGQYCVKNYEI
ncbi:MAG: acyl-CoA thioesterase/BAAT N-terminal domain-containing protein [Chlamydiales bacterium]